MSEAPLAIAIIQQKVAAAAGINARQMMSRRQSWDVVRPRQVAMYLSTIHTQNSLVEIGRAFGRDHTTVIHARDRIAVLRADDADLDRMVRGVEKTLAIDCEVADAADEVVALLCAALKREILLHLARDPVRTLRAVIAALSVLRIPDR